MPDLFYYSFKLSICLGVIYLFYQLALRNLTFYNWNRWFFLVGTGLSFLIPLIDVLPLLEMRQASGLPIISAIPAMDNFSVPVLYTNSAPDTFLEEMLRFLPILFGMGVMFQGAKLLLQFMSFFRIRRSGVLLRDGAVKVYQVDKRVAPFSFGNAIFLNKNLLQPAELDEIIRHEWVHVSQRHTIDVMWIEFLTLVNWFNPFVWLLKQAVRQNLEFIADRAVLTNPGADKKNYQYLLLKVIGLPDFNIANQFNISSLKSRIIMINRTPSSRHELARFLFVLPLMAILLLAFRGNAKTNPTETILAIAAKADLGTPAIQDTLVPPPPPPPLPPPPPPPPPVPASSEKEETKFEPLPYESFLKQNPDVKRLDVQNQEIVVELESGKVEKYNMTNKTEHALFKQRYGELPPPPPPVRASPK